MRKYPVQNALPNDENVIAVGFDPDEVAIATLAYHLWKERGRPEGSADEDWFRAKELLRSGHAAIASSTSP